MSIRQNQFSQFKILNYTDKLQTLADGDDVWPVMAEIDLTDACNHRCGFCLYGDTRVPRTFLEREHAYRALGQMREKGVASVVFKGGGEPTISPVFADCLHHAKSLAYRIGIVTNGGNLDGRNRGAIVAYSDWIRVSLDAASAEVHEKIHNPVNNKRTGFDRIIGHLRWLIDRRKSVNPELTVGINFTANVDNYFEIAAAAQLAKSIGVDYISFRNVMCVGDELPDSVWEAIRRAFEVVTWHSTEHFIVTVRYQRKGLFEQRGWESCRAPALVAIVQASGDVVACCDSRGHAEYVFGNIKEQSFEQMWMGERRRQIIRNLLLPKCLNICTDRYGYQNRAIDYLSGHRHHAAFL